MTTALIGEEAVAQALATDKVCARVMAKGLRPSHGDLIGVRLNLNLVKTQNIAVQTIHKGNASGGYRKGKGLYNGATIWYQRAVVLTDVYFNVSQPGRQRIAAGEEAKFPMASCDGLYDDETDPFFDGLEVRFNPKTIHLFADLENRPVRWAERVTVYGSRVYCQGAIHYYDEDTAPERAGDAPSAIAFELVAKPQAEIRRQVGTTALCQAALF